MGMPTPFSTALVSELFFRRIRELSVRSLKELKEGNVRPELRLIARVDKGGVELPLLRSFGSLHGSYRSFSGLQSTSRISRLVRA